MKASRILLFALLTLTTLISGAADTATADGAVVLRDTTVHTAPAADSEIIAKLARDDLVGVVGRQGLWILLAADGTRAAGWTRLTSLRLTGASSGNAPPSGGSIGGGFARLSRSVGGLFGGFRGRQAQPNAVATIGVRGLTPGEIQAAQFDAAAWAAVVATAASTADASTFARAGSLTARTVPAAETLTAAGDAQ